MKNLVPFFQRFGVWVYLTGSLIFYVSTSFPDSIWGTGFLILGALVVLVEPVVFVVARQKMAVALDRGLLFSWLLAAAALFAFLARFFLEVPVERLAAGEDAFLPRLRLVLLFVFVLLYVASIVYRLMVSLSFSVQAVQARPSALGEQKRAYLKNAAYSVFALLPVLALLNYVVALRNPSADLSPGYFSFSQPARSIIRSVQNDVDVHAFLPERQAVQARANRNRQPELYRITDELRVMLEQLPVLNSRIKLHFHNADLEAFNTQDFGTVSNGTIIFRVTRAGFTSPTDKPYVERRVYVTSQRDFERMERDTVQALVYVSSPERQLYFTAANGERYALTDANSRLASVESLKEHLRFFNSVLNQLDTRNEWPGPVPDRATALFVLGPTVPLAPEARTAILDYIKKGGRLFVAIDPAGREDFSWLMAELGGKRYKLNRSVLTNVNLTGVTATDQFPEHPLTQGLQSAGPALVVYPLGGFFEEDTTAAASSSVPPVGETKAPNPEKPADNQETAAGGEKTVQSPAVLVPREILASPYNSYIDTNRNGRRDGSEQAARRVIGLAYDRPNHAAGPKVVLFAGVDWMADRGLSYPVEQRNLQLVSQALFWMTENPLVTAIVPEARQTRTIQITDDSKLRLIIIGIVLFPVLVSAGLAGSIYYYRRKRRFAEES